MPPLAMNAKLSNRHETVMRRASLALLASIALALSLAAVAAGGPRTLDVVLPGTKSTYVDTGKKGYSRGDYFLATGRLLDKVGGKRIGGLAGVWTLISPAADDASIALHLEQGTIYIDGRIRHTAKTSVLRVAGGTGAFDSAHGKVVFRYLTETSAALQIAIS